MLSVEHGGLPYYTKGLQVRAGEGTPDTVYLSSATSRRPTYLRYVYLS